MSRTGTRSAERVPEVILSAERSGICATGTTPVTFATGMSGMRAILNSPLTIFAASRSGICPAVSAGIRAESKVPETIFVASRSGIRPMPNIPVVIFAASRSGISTDARERKVGFALTPDKGPASISFLACVARSSARLPLPVTGEPATVRMDGAVSPTEVTVPFVAGALHTGRPAEFTLRTWPVEPIPNAASELMASLKRISPFAVAAIPVPPLVTPSVPEVLVAMSRTGTRSAERVPEVILSAERSGIFATPNVPVTFVLGISGMRAMLNSPLTIFAASRSGISEATKLLKSGLASIPEAGPIKAFPGASVGKFIFVVSRFGICAMEKTPVGTFEASRLGISPASKTLKVGVPGAAPAEGPIKTSFAL